jgi:hypothetical protein
MISNAPGCCYAILIDRHSFRRRIGHHLVSAHSNHKQNRPPAFCDGHFNDHRSCILFRRSPHRSSPRNYDSGFLWTDLLRPGETAQHRFPLFRLREDGQGLRRSANNQAVHRWRQTGRYGTRCVYPSGSARKKSFFEKYIQERNSRITRN